MKVKRRSSRYRHPQDQERIVCDDYLAHRDSHRRDGRRWICDVCEVTGPR